MSALYSGWWCLPLGDGAHSRVSSPWKQPRTQPPHPLRAARYKMSPHLSAFKYANVHLRFKCFSTSRHARQLKTFCIKQKNQPIAFFFFAFVCKLTSYSVSSALTQAAQRQPVIIKSNVTGGRQRYQTEITCFLPPI